MAVVRLVSGAVGNGGARSGSSRDNAAARIVRIASGSSTVAINRKRPPQRGQASTSISNARLIGAAHAQCGELGAAAGPPLAFAVSFANTTGAWPRAQ
jgi:hypothetical protein